MGSLGTAAMTSMEERLSWFRAMSAENRSWVGLVAQAGIAAFVDWVKHPGRGRPSVAGEVFGTAPRELARAVSLQQTVEMVRVTIDVVEAEVDQLAAPGVGAVRRNCARRCSATPGRSRSGPPRCTPGRPRRAAPGTPGWKHWSWTRWSA